LGEDGTAAVDPPRGSRASPLLRAKLRAPAPPEHFVRRQRLVDLLDELTSCPLTLVVAPAGAGKSTLVADWLAWSSIAGAWLSLDPSDRDTTQFWSGVIGALDVLAPGNGDGALALLRSARPAAEIVGELLNSLDEGRREPAVVVIDDVHLLDDDAELAQSLGTFLLHLPGWLHVVLLSRHHPNLPVDRLRASGQVGEVRFSELRFSSDEASLLLSRLAPSLSEDEVDDAAAGVDGWAAGLQMAALAARSSFAQPPVVAHDPGRELLIHDFVWHEVLGGAADDLVELMLDVAVVERVNASLAAALSGRSDANELLLRAESEGLFVVRLGVGGWFEVHSLVRAALLAELERRSRTRLAERHARAAQWFEDEGEVVVALEHWTSAGRPRDALRLLAVSHADLYDTGREATILRTIEAIPAAVTSGDLESMLEYAWCLLLVDRRRFTDAVEEATWWAGHSPVPDVVRARLTMLQSCAAVVNGDWARSGRLAREAMGQMGDRWWDDPLGRFGWNHVARDAALSECWDDSGDDVRDAKLALSRDPKRQLTFEGTRAMGHALSGRPVDALQVAAGVRHAATVSNMTILRGELAIAEAIAHRELGDRERALAELQALADAPAETMLYCKILATLQLAHAHLDVGALDAARFEFERAESIVVAESFGPGGREWLARTGTQLALASGDVDDARQWAARVDDPFWRGLSAARVQLAVDNGAEALDALETTVPRCPRHDVILGLLRARATDDRHESEKHAIAAFELASSCEMLQTVGSEGLEVLELAERAAWREPGPWLDRLRRTVASGAERPATGGGHQLVERLTDRERDVLRYLPSRLTLGEIADELYVSVNTLKFHLKVIYRKLGVSSRAEAAAKARQLRPR
jgi:ATP/maltotriose-dependent transcriptional regulator MalT